MKITVILCTHNRCSSLALALSSVAGQTLPDPVEWEVLVVDNNSQDQTHDVVADFGRRYHGRFRYLFEPQPGKSHALNFAIREARADILAFMDDDVIVEPGWLENLTAPLLHGEYAGAGGRILPQPSFLPPIWLPRTGPYALAPFALFDLGPNPGQLSEPPFGANMAFRKSMFEKYGAFRTDLGPNPDNLIRGEDTEFGSRLLAAGERLRYAPTAVVHHPVLAERVRKNYFLAWWFDKARADIRQHGVEPHGICCRGIPLLLFRRLALWTMRWIVAANPRVRFERKLKVWSNAGMIAECHRRVRYGPDPCSEAVPTHKDPTPP
jgi:GT2 family glycosyltransferase